MYTTTSNTITAREAALIDGKLSIPAKEAALGTSVRNVQIDTIAQQASLDALVGTWTSVTAVGYQGNRTVTQINALSPSKGDVYVSTDSGTPSAGSSDALTAGDVTEYNGTSWKKLLDGVNSVVPAGTVLVIGNGTLVSPLVDGSDEKKYATFNGTSNTPTLSDSTAGDKRVVSNSTSVSYGQVFELATTWNMVTPVQLAAAADRVTNTTTQTAFANTRTVPLPNLGLYDRIQFDAAAVVVGATSTPTLAIVVQLYDGSAYQEIGAFEFAAAASNDECAISGYLDVVTLGSSGVLQGAYLSGGISGGSPVGAAGVVRKTINLSANRALRVTAQWGAASASNQVDLRALSYRIVPAGV